MELNHKEKRSSWEPHMPMWAVRMPEFSFWPWQWDMALSRCRNCFAGLPRRMIFDCFLLSPAFNAGQARVWSPTILVSCAHQHPIPQICFCAKAHLTILIMSYFRSLCPGFRGKSVFSVCDGRTSLEYFYVDLTALPLDSVLNHNDLLIATSDPTYKRQCVFVIPRTPEVWCFALLLFRTHKIIFPSCLLFLTSLKTDLLWSLCEYPPFLDLYKPLPGRLISLHCI